MVFIVRVFSLTKQTAVSQNGKAGGLTLSKTVLAGSIRAPRAFFQPKFGKD